MTAIETAKAVLAKASLFDQTFATPDLAIAVAWAEVLGDTDRDDALQAVTDHYSTTPRRVMPADVLSGVRRIRADRIRAVRSDVLEPADVDASDPVAYLDAVRARRRAIGDGQSLDDAGSPFPARDVERLLKSTLKRLPQVPEVSA